MTRRIRCSNHWCWYCNPEPSLAIAGTVAVALLAAAVAWRWKP